MKFTSKKSWRGSCVQRSHLPSKHHENKTRKPFTWVLMRTPKNGRSPKQKIAKQKIQDDWSIFFISQILVPLFGLDGKILINFGPWNPLSFRHPAFGFPEETLPWCLEEDGYQCDWPKAEQETKAREIVNLKGFIFKLTFEDIMCGMFMFLYNLHCRRRTVSKIVCIRRWYVSTFIFHLFSKLSFGSGGTAALTQRMIFEFHKSWQL